MSRPVVAGRGHVRHGDGVADEVGLVGAQEHDRSGAQTVALADGHRAAGERTTGVHPIDRDLDRCIGRPAAGEDRVDRLDALPVLSGEGGDDRLPEQLPAEDHAVPDFDVIGAIAVGTDGLECEPAHEVVDGGHGYFGGKRNAPSSRMFSPFR
jgi:hypothetical protein